jgi:hypothetical protein
MCRFWNESEIFDFLCRAPSYATYGCMGKTETSWRKLSIVSTLALHQQWVSMYLTVISEAWPQEQVLCLSGDSFFKPHIHCFMTVLWKRRYEQSASYHGTFNRNKTTGMRGWYNWYIAVYGTVKYVQEARIELRARLTLSCWPQKRGVTGGLRWSWCPFS